jgi:hypothetical protein
MGTSSVANSALQHLSRFAIASIFVGVGWLALAHPALAQIVYTPTDITIGPNTSYNLDLNNDGVTDFVISTSYACAWVVWQRYKRFFLRALPRHHPPATVPKPSSQSVPQHVRATS